MFKFGCRGQVLGRIFGSNSNVGYWVNSWDQHLVRILNVLLGLSPSLRVEVMTLKVLSKHIQRVCNRRQYKISSKSWGRIPQKVI